VIISIPPTVERFLRVADQVARLRANYEARGGAWPSLEEELVQFERAQPAEPDEADG
jgi:hypothetical protein